MLSFKVIDDVESQPCHLRIQTDKGVVCDKALMNN